MAVVVTSKSLTKVLVGAGAAAAATPKDTRSEPPPVVSLSTRLVMLVEVLDTLVAVNSGFSELRDQVKGEVNRPFDDVQVAPSGWRDLEVRVDRTLEIALRVAPNITGLAKMEEPSRWVPGVAQQISLAAVRAGAMYGNALRRSWNWGDIGLEQSLLKAEKAAAALPKLIVEAYIGPFGVWPHLAEIGQLRDQLLAMKTDSGRSPWGTDPGTPDAVRVALGDVGIASLAAGSLDWLLLKRFRDEHALALAMWAGHEPAAERTITELNRRVQAVLVTLTALTLDEQLTTFRESLVLLPAVALRGRLKGYQDRLLPILTGLHGAFTLPPGAGQLAALSALRVLTDDPVLRDDTETVITALGVAKTVQEVLLVGAITVAAGLTGCVAAGFAGMVIGAFASDVAVAGIATWAAIGGFVVDQIVQTAVTRYANEALSGPGAVTTPFYQDLFWNALSAGFLHGVKYGVGANFSRLRTQWPSGFEKVAWGAEQISMAGFGVAQRVITTGEWPTGEQFLRSLLEQAVQVGMGALSGRLIKSLSTRKPNLGISAVDLAAADQRSADLATLVTKVNERTATEAEVLSLPAKIEEVRNAEVEVIAKLPDSPEKKATLAEYKAEAAELELRMAMLGLSAALATPGHSPAFEPKGPGVVAVSEVGQPVLEKFAKDHDGVITDTPDGDLRKVKLGNGQVVFAVDAGPSAATPAAADFTAATNDAFHSASVTEFGAVGLENLKRLFPGKTSVQEILADIQGKGDKKRAVAPFLRMMAHPDFATLTGKQSRAAVVAIGRNADIRDFASLYGPKATLAIRSKIKASGNANPAWVVEAYSKADALIQAEPTDAARTALIDQMIAMPAAALRTLLGTGVVPKRRPLPINQETAGVDVDSLQWKSIFARIEKKYPTHPLAQQRARANLEQMLERAEAQRYYTLSHDSMIAIMEKFDTYCTDAGLTVNGDMGPRNNKYGAMIEWYLLPRGAGQKQAWFEKNTDGVPLNKKGVTIPDAWDEVNKVGIQTEVKGSMLNAPGATPTSTASGHLTEAIADATNIPDGSEIHINYFHVPPETVQQAMIYVFGRHDSPVTQVRFDRGPWRPVVRRPPP